MEHEKVGDFDLYQSLNKNFLFHIALYQPEIPPNTGTIQRVCAATQTALHLIGPLGFRLDERSLKRAGMDYRQWVEVFRYTDWQEYVERGPSLAKTYAVSTKGARTHAQASYQPGDCFLFGSESRGLPQEILTEQQERVIRIPMAPVARSLNLAVSVSIVLYEALRQNQFGDLT
ncbi:MAG: tRNA (cytidine(34)-2'-O)-methyltransferase [Magnetococcales bacterium]|nr:tRNA (cytidine(34)-2'-O)-methyltransferase [Magnetococcales bacterium]NGZ26365.1 tRNA (cytidine(34)-2'-O)-methyltransferase [Magnetococcales bacterium]